MQPERLRTAFAEVDRAFAHRGPARGKQRAFTEDARERMAWRLAMSRHDLVSVPTAAERLGLTVAHVADLIEGCRITVYRSRGFVFVNPSTIAEEAATGRHSFTRRHLVDLSGKPDAAACRRAQAVASVPTTVPTTPFDAPSQWTDLARIDAVRVQCLAESEQAAPADRRVAVARAAFLACVASSEALVALLPAWGAPADEPITLAVWTAILVEGWRCSEAGGSCYFDRRDPPPADAWPPTALALFNAEHRRRRRPPSAWARMEGVPLERAFYGCPRGLPSQLEPFAFRDRFGVRCVPPHVANAAYRSTLEAERAAFEVAAAIAVAHDGIVGPRDADLSPEAQADAIRAVARNARRLSSATTAARLLWVPTSQLCSLANGGAIPRIAYGPLLLFDVVAVRDALTELALRDAAGLPERRYSSEDLLAIACHGPPKPTKPALADRRERRTS